jgi:hypothetical protein
MPSFLGLNAIFSVSLAADLVGLQVPGTGRNLEIKPYAISSVRTDRAARPSVFNKRAGNIGADAKYGVTKSVTLDMTYNTDFAQVEDDVQQVNLTRFNLLYPEKREFFLEGQGTFAFGGATTGDGGISTTSIPVLFFSRTIGLSNGHPVPIVGGARLTGKIGDYSIGALNIESASDVSASAHATNFSAVRIKRDLFRRSNIGVLYTRRADTVDAAGAGDTLGVDGLFSASRNLNITGSVARTRTPGLRGGDTSHLARLNYNADRYGLQVEQLAVGRHFNPQAGFVRRTDFRREFAQARFSPRPAPTYLKGVRRFIYQGNLEYVEDGAGTVEARGTEATFAMELQNSDRLTVVHAITN